MKIKVLREKIKKAVICVEKVVGKETTLPILSNIMISGKKNILCITATNLETSISWNMLAKIENDGESVLPAQVFLGLINSLTGSSLTIETEKNTIYIVDEKIKVKLNTIPPDDFPQLSLVGEGECFNVNAVEFCRLLARVASFTAQSSVKPEINGVCLIFENEFVKAVATDSFRLGEGMLMTPKQKLLTKKHSIILPTKAIREIIAIFGDIQKNINVYINNNQVIVEFDDDSDIDQPKIRFTSRLIEGDFPDYQAIIPSVFISTAIFNKKDILNQLKPAGIFAGKSGDITLSILVKNKVFKILSQSVNLGEYEGEINSKALSGEDIKIIFNHRFLTEGVLAIDGDDDCVIDFSQNDGPAILKSVKNNDFMYIVMPIKK